MYRGVEVPGRWAKGRYIALFAKTPRGIVCPSFWEFKPFTGCPFSCSYCYLQGTFYGNKAPRAKDFTQAARELDEFLTWADHHGLRLLLNTGELADSLAVPAWTERLIKLITPVLERHHRLLLLSKAGLRHIKPLLDHSLQDRVVVSFSLNPPKVAERYEVGAAPPEERVKAAALLEQEGYTVRVRVDPMIPVEGWRVHYYMLLAALLAELSPERVTLGTLRGLRKTLRFAGDRSWARFLRERTGWGLKLEGRLRAEMYRLAITCLRELGYKGPIALCKETEGTWMKLHREGLLPHPGKRGAWQRVRCNCQP